jgi:hypothetical protein
MLFKVQQHIRVVPHTALLLSCCCCCCCTNQVAAGAFYEAQQMYKTVYHRYKSRKQLQDSYLVLASGSVQQLSSHQVNCGMELANMLLEAYTANQEPANQQTLGSIQVMADSIPLYLGSSAFVWT